MGFGQYFLMNLINAKIYGLSLLGKCPNQESFFSLSSDIFTEYKDLRCKSPYSIKMRENTDQKKLWIQTFFLSAHHVYFRIHSIYRNIKQILYFW